MTFPQRGDNFRTLGPAHFAIGCIERVASDRALRMKDPKPLRISLSLPADAKFRDIIMPGAVLVRPKASEAEPAPAEPKPEAKPKTFRRDTILAFVRAQGGKMSTAEIHRHPGLTQALGETPFITSVARNLGELARLGLVISERRMVPRPDPRAGADRQAFWCAAKSDAIAQEEDSGDA